MNIEQSWSHATCIQCGNWVPTEVPRLAAEIETLKKENQSLQLDLHNFQAREIFGQNQLAASQAREKVLREALVLLNGPTRQDRDAAIKAYSDAIALPQDSSALDALLAKERERCANELQAMSQDCGCAALIRGLR